MRCKAARPEVVPSPPLHPPLSLLQTSPVYPTLRLASSASSLCNTIGHQLSGVGVAADHGPPSGDSPAPFNSNNTIHHQFRGERYPKMKQTKNKQRLFVSTKTTLAKMTCPKTAT